MSARPDTGRGVTHGVVLDRSGHVTPQLRQIGRQLQHPVDSADEHLTCSPVDGQVSEGGVERSVHHPACCRGGRGWTSWGREERGGEEKEREEEEEGKRRGRGGKREHGGER